MPSREVSKPKGVDSEKLSDVTGMSVIPIGGNLWRLYGTTQELQSATTYINRIKRGRKS